MTAETFDWAGVGAGNALYGIARRPADRRPVPDRLGQRPDAPGAIATDSDTLAKTYQINEKLTWLKGRHTLKFGGQFLHYDQRRFYAGNNGLLGFINYNGAFTGFAFSDFLLDMASSKGRGGGDPTDPWTHLQNRIGLFVQDDFKVTPNLTLNLGLRWAYTSPLVEKDNRQSNFDLVTGQQIFAEDGSIEDRALYKPVLQGLRAAARRRVIAPAIAGCSAAATASRSSWRAPAPTCGCRSTRRSSSSRRSTYDHDDRRRQRGERLRRPRAGHDADRQRPRLRSEPAAAVHAAVERVRRVPGHARRCRRRSATSAIMPITW